MAKKSRVHYSSAGGGDVGDMVSWFRSKIESVENGTSDAIRQFAEDGAETARHLVETRGTLKSGKQGRIETGRMVNAIKSSFNPSTKNGNASGRFGWLRDRQDYFAFQEGGFQHSPGVEVEGMYAMLDAYHIVRGEFEANVSDVMRNA